MLKMHQFQRSPVNVNAKTCFGLALMKNACPDASKCLVCDSFLYMDIMIVTALLWFDENDCGCDYAMFARRCRGIVGVAGITGATESTTCMSVVVERKCEQLFVQPTIDQCLRMVESASVRAHILLASAEQYSAASMVIVSTQRKHH